MNINPSLAASELYNINMVTFENSQPEEFLALLKNFKIAINGIGTTSVTVRIKYLRMIFCGEAIREFDELASQNNGIKNTHLNHITESLLGYLPPINAISKQNQEMLRAIREPQDLMFERFFAQLRKLNNYLPLLPVSSKAKKMPPRRTQKYSTTHRS